MKLNYLSDGQTIALSCINYGRNSTVHAKFFNKSLDVISKSYSQFSQCQNIYGHSIIQYNSTYYIISDVVCDNYKRCYEPLEGELSPIIITTTQNIEFFEVEEKEEEEEEESKEKEKEDEEKEEEFKAKEEEKVKEEENIIEEIFEEKVEEMEEEKSQEKEKIKFSEEIKIINKSELVQKMKESLINIKNLEDIDKGTDHEIYDQNILVSLTNTNNQKNNQNKKKTTIDLGECENILKTYYNISIDSYLYILKMDIKEEGMKIPKIEYEIYYPLDGRNLIKLNLSLCHNKKIDITIPVEITDDISKYNSSSDYYNDICSLATSKNSTDITLNDRKNEFINNNMTLCDEDCELINYSYDNAKVKCSCDIKIEMPLIDDIKFDKKKLIKKFKDIKNIVNLKVMKCFKSVFVKNNLKDNFGFVFILFIILLYFICLIIFVTQSYSKLKSDIRNIHFSLNNKKEKKPIKQYNLKQNLIQLDVIKASQLNKI